MTDIVDPDQIEDIVGARRHPTRHIGRAISEADDDVNLDWENTQ